MGYFYIIEHIFSGVKYAGCQTSKKANPSTFMTDKGYKTSSKVVNILIAEQGTQSFRVLELLTEGDLDMPFGTDVASYETWFLRENDCAGSPDWFNMHNNNGCNFASEEFKRKAAKTNLLKFGNESFMRSESAKGIGLGFKEGNTLGCFPRSEHTKKLISEVHKGKVVSEETCKRMAESKIGLKASDEAKLKMSKARTGKPRPQSWHDKMAEYRAANPNPMLGKVSVMRGKKFPTIICEHCGKEASKGNYLRWHGENCKHKEPNE